MPATFTASDQFATPRAVHVGMNVARAVFNANGTGFSLSDVVQAIRVPNGALIVDAYVSGVLPADAGTSTVKLGVGSAANPMTDVVTTGGTTSTTLSATALIASVTLSATAKLARADGGNLPFRVSLSDDANPQWAWVYLTRITGTTTNTCSIQVVVQYIVGA